MTVRDNVDYSNPSRIVRVNKQEQLDLYDALPKRWRDLVDSLPIPQDLKAVQLYYEELGEERGFDEIVKQFEAAFPGWKGPQI